MDVRERSTETFEKPVAPLLFQESLTEPKPGAADAERDTGAVRAFVVAHTDVDVADMKALATAVTVKQYFVAGFRPTTLIDFCAAGMPDMVVDAGDISVTLNDESVSVSVHASVIANGEDEAVAVRVGTFAFTLVALATAVYGPNAPPNAMWIR